jgi:hypothetical protein
VLWIREWLRKKIAIAFERLLRRRQPVPVSVPPPLSSEPAESVEQTIIGYNRKLRRQLERRRRKHDKFVTPKGELPESKPAAPKQPPLQQARRVEIVVDDDGKDAEVYLHGKHHEDTQEVLYAEAEIYGEFNFRDTILQQLERYFVYLERMKKHDNDAYHLYRQYGATLLPYVNTNANDRKIDSTEHWEPKMFTLADWFHQTRPAFGCFVYGADPESEKYEMTAKGPPGMIVWLPKFMYFTKYKMPPATIQHITGGDIYAMTIWWDRPQDSKTKSKYGVPQEFGIWISTDGKQVIALRSLDTKMVPIWSRRKHESFRIPERAWHIPHDFEEWAKLHHIDPQKFLTGLFLESVQRHELAQYSMVRVAASKDDMTAVFSVNIHKMGYFFQDRDIHVNANGIRKRIFHMVRAHTRRDGTVIKFHFRGERQFTWADYNILITIPGRDHINYADLNAGFYDSSWKDEAGDHLGMEEFGKLVAEGSKPEQPQNSRR